MMTEGAGVERRLKATYLVSAAATFGMAYVAIECLKKHPESICIFLERRRQLPKHWSEMFA